MTKPHTYNEAQGEEIVHALRSYGVLTHDTLCEIVSGQEWRESHFDVCLAGLVKRGRVTRLGEELYELSEEERAPAAGASAVSASCRGAPPFSAASLRRSRTVVPFSPGISS